MAEGFRPCSLLCEQEVDTDTRSLQMGHSDKPKHRFTKSHTGETNEFIGLPYKAWGTVGDPKAATPLKNLTPT